MSDSKNSSQYKNSNYEPGTLDLFKQHKIITIATIVIVLGIALLIMSKQKIDPSYYKVSNFEECLAAGYPAMESHPRQCRTKDGLHFIEQLTNPLDF